LKNDPSTVTGKRLALPIEGMPVNLDDHPVDPEAFNRWDGFSPSGPMLAAFATGVSNANLPTWKNPDESLAVDAPIVLLDMATGQRQPFFAEVDQNTVDITKRNLIIRPLVRLAGNTRYAVAIRKSVKAADGSELPLSDAFAAAVADTSYKHPRFDAARYKEIFAALETAGVPRTDLALAWDFHTASDAFLQSDLVTMRDAALPAMGVDGANLTFRATAQMPRAGVYRSYTGTFTTPDFLTGGESDTSKLRRGSDGRPVMQGMRDARFAAIIPDCVATQPLPRPTILFGHGIFGSAEEYLDNGFVIDLAQDYCFVIVAGDFIGLTSRQLALAPLAVNDLNKGAGVTEKLEQSIIDFIALSAALRGPMRTSPDFAYNGTPVIDHAKLFYVGGSLGGTMGNTFMALEPHIQKGVLAVPGGVWSLLFERSNAWHLLKGAAMGAYEDPEVYQLNIAFFGMAFEPVDPITTARHVIQDPLPGVPLKSILVWYAIGDTLVTNIATEIVARTMGIDLLGPSAKSVWGMPAKNGPLANGVMVFDEHPKPMPSDLNLTPTVENGTHSGVNKNPAALRAVEQFLLHDQIVQTCGGATPAPCDCTTGACD
jgi:hypothetical protein